MYIVVSHFRQWQKKNTEHLLAEGKTRQNWCQTGESFKKRLWLHLASKRPNGSVCTVSMKWNKTAAFMSTLDLPRFTTHIRQQKRNCSPPHSAVAHSNSYVLFVFSLPRNAFGAFAKLRKATISLVIYVRLSVRLSARNNSASTGGIFMKFDIWIFFEHLSKKFFTKNLTRITGTLHEDSVPLWPYLAQSYFRQQLYRR